VCELDAGGFRVDFAIFGRLQVGSLSR